ncbi:pyruvate kinase [Thermosyntropha lipolytica DSM 11003]|uniref:Pyruvate kinase n=1 Tax=Thermosyntropha lipolytica DSM 11003 TaxID=1123382 RepID=A0A1M5N201_9FIRM|nr:pyruvate kinase [Thermosyntropha lipolytica]SHG83033.1 pyruvate kinase [Thermosyntropha lipolytica DSM 11003]
MRKTKIICTIGPASEKVEILEEMLQKGMNVARLNFSHGTHEEHKRRIDNLRLVARDKREPLAIMLDTKGPEIRTGKLEKGKVKLLSGQRFVLTTRDIIGNEKEVHVNYPHLPEEIEIGTSILLADGLISLLVEEIKGTDIVCRVINGGELGEKKGVNIPGVPLNLPFLSEKDKEDIIFGIENEVDYIAASFVRTADDVLEIRRILESRGADIDIIAKIESQEAVNNLDDIIKVADGIMVARGDLGVEIPAEEVPLVQRKIVEKCNQAGKMVIIATQMLESMINNPRPTRAEVSDVANAIFGGADAVMLSGETAAGKYPVIVVETMARIAKRAEEDLAYDEILRRKALHRTNSVTDAISYATCATAANLDAGAIITATRTGYTAKMVAKYRPQAKIIAATPDRRVFNKLALVWGVYPVVIDETEGTDALFEESIKKALENGYIKHGDLVVLTAGTRASVSGGTNLLKVHVVGNILLEGMGIGDAVSGRVKIVVHPDDLAKVEAGDIVVTTGADEMLAPCLEKIAGLIAEEGGLTSNAAIMGLTYHIPVIVGAANATSILKDGMIITMDTPRGKVYQGLAQVK